uniref:Uncharacterized protein n=1 Tax=Solanum lycopersicum TaxID=4081 RepID=A0A3Q7J6W8_SOLLC
TQPLVTLPL